MRFPTFGRAFLLAAIALLPSPGALQAGGLVRSLAEIRYQNVIPQKWDLSCGAAALATLLTYDLADPVSEKAVATEILRKRDPSKIRKQGGFSLLDLQEVAVARGYEADGYGNLTITDLASMLPAIVPLELSRGDHFVVVRQIGSDDVVFADPAFGNRRLSTTAFAGFWVQKVAFVARRPH